MVAAYPDALFDLERASGAHDILAFAEARQHERARGIDTRGRLTDQALDQLQLRDFLEHAGSRHALCVARGFSEGIERPLRHPDDRRDQRRRAESRIAKTRLSIAGHIEPRHLAGKDRADRQYPVRRDEDRIVDRDRLRAGALQAADIPAVVIDYHVAHGNETPGECWRRVLSGNQRPTK